ncbi:MAG: transcriptional regulator [Pseudomonadota bacterium]
MSCFSFARAKGITALTFSLAFWATVTSAHCADLIMFEQDYCEWCEKWNEEVGVIYAKTSEGKRAPLKRVNIHAPIPNEFSFVRVERFTPTFVLVDGGAEIGRIRGYPGEDFFWGLLGQLIKKLPAPTD